MEANAERGASCFLGTVVRRNHSSVPRLRRSYAIANRLSSLSAASLGVRQAAKTMQNEAPTASNKRQVLDAASFTCDGAFPSHAEKKTNQKKKGPEIRRVRKVKERVEMLKRRIMASDAWLSPPPLTQHRSLFPGNQSAGSSLSPRDSSCCASLNVKVQDWFLSFLIHLE